MKGADPLLDDGVADDGQDSGAFGRCMANNLAVPFCYPATFEFKSQ